MRKNVISAVGISVVDHIMILDGFKTGEGSFHCESYLVEGGGMAATALCAAAKLSAETRLFSRIGDDLNGVFILDELKRYGVDTAGVVTIPGKASTVSFVLVDKMSGEKQFYSEWIKPAFEDRIELDISLLKGTEVLLVDGHWTEGALKASEWAKTNGVPVVADFKRKYTNLEALFPFIDYFVIPSFFAEELTGAADPEDMLAGLAAIQPGVPVITLGDFGGMYLFEGKVRRYRSFPVQCVDSTGAGDAFHGAFCRFLTQNLDLHRCLELASAVGALNCRAFGGRTGLPTAGELSEFLVINGCDAYPP